MDKPIRLSEDALHQRHAPDCAGYKLGQKSCDCLVAVVIALQAELDGRFGWRFSLNPDIRAACTVQTPDHKKVRLTTYPDGRLRMRVLQGSPLLLHEAHMSGQGTDVVVTLVPEGWKRPPEAMRTDYMIGFTEKPGAATMYFPRRYRPDLPIGQQWETSRHRARVFSTQDGARQVISELSTKVAAASLSIMPTQRNKPEERES